MVPVAAVVVLVVSAILPVWFRERWWAEEEAEEEGTEGVGVSGGREKNADEDEG